MRRIVMFGAAVVAGLVSAMAFGQTYYLPQQYQYGTENSFYYAGSNPAVFAAEAGLASLPNRERFAAYRGTRIYSDAIPTLNAAVYGFTTADVANASNRQQPTYFSMRQLREAAVVMQDGTRVVPATAGAGGSGVVAAYVPAVRQGAVVVTQKGDPTKPGYIMVIMKPSGGMMGGTSREATPSCPSSTPPNPKSAEAPRSASF
jgi:hypothetical protein